VAIVVGCSHIAHISTKTLRLLFILWLQTFFKTRVYCNITICMSVYCLYLWLQLDINGYLMVNKLH